MLEPRAALASQDALPADTPTPIGVPDSQGLDLDAPGLILKLLFVVGLAYGSLLLLRRAGRGPLLMGVNAPEHAYQLRVLSSLRLGPNRSIVLVQLPGGKGLVVGSTPTHLERLADLDLSELPPPNISGEMTPSFLDYLGRAVRDVPLLPPGTSGRAPRA